MYTEFSLLVFVENLTQHRRSMIRTLADLFIKLGKNVNPEQRNSVFLQRSYLQLLMIEKCCQYIEDAAIYQIASKSRDPHKFAKHIVSYKPGEATNFWKRLNPTTKELKILKEFWKKYFELYLSIKHGNRVILHEVAQKKVPKTVMDSYVGIQYIRKDCSLNTVLLKSNECEYFIKIADICHTFINNVLKKFRFESPAP